MSVTFNMVSGRTIVGPVCAPRTEPCLCAQFAPSWNDAFRDGVYNREDLAAHAAPACPFCTGTGVETVSGSPELELSLCNANAVALLGVIGFLGGNDLCGSMPLPETRRAIMRARALFEKKAPAFTREIEVEFGEPCEDEDGTIILRPLRRMAGGLDMAGLRARFDTFATLVEQGAIEGATHVSWG